MFKVRPNGATIILYRFTGGADGAFPGAGLTGDAGNLFGTTPLGGGVVFELSPTGTETVLYSFCAQAACADGGGPVAGLIRDAAGNLYGTTSGGGDFACSCGVVFKVDPTGHETVLYTFRGGADGADPEAGLVRDAAGNLYGTTRAGGASGLGVVFKLTP